MSRSFNGVIIEALMNDMDFSKHKKILQKAIDEYDFSEHIINAINEYFTSEDFKELVFEIVDEEMREQGAVTDIVNEVLRKLVPEIQSKLKVSLK